MYKLGEKYKYYDGSEIKIVSMRDLANRLKKEVDVTENQVSKFVVHYPTDPTENIIYDPNRKYDLSALTICNYTDLYGFVLDVFFAITRKINNQKILSTLYDICTSCCSKFPTLETILSYTESEFNTHTRLCKLLLIFKNSMNDEEIRRVARCIILTYPLLIKIETKEE